MTSESELLRRYARQGDEAAFAEVVRSQVNMVYSAARRLVGGDAHLAQEVAQKVFTDLARKSALLCHRATLGGWLHTSTRYAARDAVASQQRRRQREQEAGTMQAILSTPAEIPWEQLRPVLDDAVGQLNEHDWEAVVLRFFQQKSHREIGATLGLTENAARMRVERALEKLRDYFSSKGIKASAALLAIAISTHAVEAAPAEFAASVTASSLARAAAQGIARNLFNYFLTMNKTSQIALGTAVVALAILPFLHSSAVESDTSPVTNIGQHQSPPPASSRPLLAATIPAEQIATPSRTRAVTSTPPPAQVPVAVSATTAAPAVTTSASMNSSSPAVSAPTAPSPQANAPTPARPPPFPKATTLPAHNMQVHVYGEVYAGYPMDATIVGVGDLQRNFIAAPSGSALNPGDAAHLRIQIALSATPNGYHVVYEGSAIITPAGARQYLTYSARGEAILKPGESASAFSSDGHSTLSLTLSEAN